MSTQRAWVSGAMTALFLLALVAVFGITAPASAGDDAVDQVVAKMEEGDVAGLCSGGRSAIVKAATKVTTELAQSGSISGNFAEIGKKAGQAFAQKNC